MVFKSQQVREVDRDGVSDAVAEALSQELHDWGIETEVVNLSGEPRLPRIELAFWTYYAAGGYGGASITADCAFVSHTDHVVFVGRINAPRKDGDIDASAKVMAKAIADVLTER